VRSIDRGDGGGSNRASIRHSLRCRCGRPAENISSVRANDEIRAAARVTGESRDPDLSRASARLCASAALLNRGGSILSAALRVSIGQALHHRPRIHHGINGCYIETASKPPREGVYTPRCKMCGRIDERARVAQSRFYTEVRLQEFSARARARARSVRVKLEIQRRKYPSRRGDNQSERAFNHEILQKLWPKSAGRRITRLAGR